MNFVSRQAVRRLLVSLLCALGIPGIGMASQVSAQEYPTCTVWDEFGWGEPLPVVMSLAVASQYQAQTIGRHGQLHDRSYAIRAFEEGLCGHPGFGHDGVNKDGVLNLAEIMHVGNINASCFGVFDPQLTPELLLAMDGSLACTVPGADITVPTVHLQATVALDPQVNLSAIWLVANNRVGPYWATALVEAARCENGGRNLGYNYEGSGAAGALQLLGHQRLTEELGLFWPTDIMDAGHNGRVGVQLALANVASGASFMAPWASSRACHGH